MLLLLMSMELVVVNQVMKIYDPIELYPNDDEMHISNNSYPYIHYNLIPLHHSHNHYMVDHYEHHYHHHPHQMQMGMRMMMMMTIEMMDHVMAMVMVMMIEVKYGRQVEAEERGFLLLMVNDAQLLAKS